MKHHESLMHRSKTYESEVKDLRLKSKKLYTEGEKYRIRELNIYRNICVISLLALWLVSAFCAAGIKDLFVTAGINNPKAFWFYKFSDFIPVFFAAILVLVGIGLSLIRPRNEFRSSNKKFELWVGVFPTYFSVICAAMPFLLDDDYNIWTLFKYDIWIAAVISILLSALSVPILHRWLSRNIPIDLKSDTFIERLDKIRGVGPMIRSTYVWCIAKGIGKKIRGSSSKTRNYNWHKLLQPFQNGSKRG